MSDLIFLFSGGPLVQREMLILTLRMDPETADGPSVVVTGTPSRLSPEHKVDAVLVKTVWVTDFLAAAYRGTRPSARR